MIKKALFAVIIAIFLSFFNCITVVPSDNYVETQMSKFENFKHDSFSKNIMELS